MSAHADRPSSTDPGDADLAAPATAGPKVVRHAAPAAPVDGTPNSAPGTPRSAPGRRAAGASHHPESTDVVVPLLGLLRWSLRHESLGNALSAGGASLNDLWLLHHVERRGEVRLSELAAWQRVDKSTVSSQVKALVQRGLLVRRPDPRDRRASLVGVSARGREESEDALRRGRAQVEAVVTGWPVEERRLLTSLLARFVADAEALGAREDRASGDG